MQFPMYLKENHIVNNIIPITYLNHTDMEFFLIFTPSVTTSIYLFFPLSCPEKSCHNNNDPYCVVNG